MATPILQKPTLKSFPAFPRRSRGQQPQIQSADLGEGAASLQKIGFEFGIAGTITRDEWSFYLRLSPFISGEMIESLSLRKISIESTIDIIKGNRSGGSSAYVRHLFLK